MNASLKEIFELHVQKTIKALEANNMTAYYVPSAKDVVDKVAQLLHEGDTVSTGGSASLTEAGVIDHLKSGRYHYLDRYEEGLTAEQINTLFRRVFSADAYLCSANAVTTQGEIYNVDGNSNRVSAILFGPTSVIMVVGRNKLVNNLDEAVRRVKTIAAPANAARLDCGTYCAKTGECVSLLKGGEMASGCTSDRRVCANFVVMGRQRVKGRVKVILVGEELGY